MCKLHLTLTPTRAPNPTLTLTPARAPNPTLTLTLTLTLTRCARWRAAAASLLTGLECAAACSKRRPGGATAHRRALPWPPGLLH